MSDKIKKLSEVMELGATFVREDRYLFWSSDGHCGCALGTAYIVIDGDLGRRDKLSALADAFSERFGISKARLGNISTQHFYGLKTRQQIIDELKAEGL